MKKKKKKMMMMMMMMMMTKKKRILREVKFFSRASMGDPRVSVQRPKFQQKMITSPLVDGGLVCPLDSQPCLCFLSHLHALFFLLAPMLAKR